MAQTLFSRIIAGEIPCHKVYEDEHVLAFLDISPLSLGHTLVVPKEDAATLAELSPESAAALGRALPPICRGICAATGAQAYNVLVNNGEAAGQIIAHVHVHVIPKIDETGLVLRWPTGELEDGPELAAKIARCIR